VYNKYWHIITAELMPYETSGMGSTILLPRLVGQETASRIFLTGQMMSSAEALKAGVLISMADRANDVNGSSSRKDLYESYKNIKPKFTSKPLVCSVVIDGWFHNVSN